ncbi:MAG: AEC family transporter [Butyrivibrio sp.]|nr:AEC family transporter [Butyrivibrio sp.]
MDFLPIFARMVELFIIIIIGYVATKIKVINRDIKAGLTKIILYISIPCTILSSVANAEKLPEGKELLILLAVSFSSYIVLFVLAKITGILLGLSGKQKGAAEFGIMFANVGFIGFPVTEAIFGSDALIYTAMFNLPFNLLCYCLGVIMIKGEKLSKFGENSSANELLKLIFTPAMISSIMALIMTLLKTQVPDLISNTLERVGGITTPGALIIIGASLAEIKVSEMFNNSKAYLFAVMSVIVTPLITYLIYKPFTADYPVLFGVTVIISAMPVATAGTMLCVEHSGDERFMAQITFLTTLLTVFSIPIVATRL